MPLVRCPGPSPLPLLPQGPEAALGALMRGGGWLTANRVVRVCRAVTMRCCLQVSSRRLNAFLSLGPSANSFPGPGPPAIHSPHHPLPYPGSRCNDLNPWIGCGLNNPSFKEVSLCAWDFSSNSEFQRVCAAFRDISLSKASLLSSSIPSFIQIYLS